MQKKLWRRSKFFAFVLLLCATLVNAEDLQEKVNARMKEFGAESVGIFCEKSDGHVFTYNADGIYHAASTMKIPVMMEVFHQVETGKLSLDQPMVVKNEFASIADGSLFALNPADDSDAELYKHVGEPVSLRELVFRMITKSSNLATNTILQIVKPENVRALTKEIGAKDIFVLRGVEDQKAFDAGKVNTTSARALAICLKTIMDAKYFNDDSRKQMFTILQSQEFRAGIPNGIHADERNLIVANKTGSITAVSHDAAIIRDAAGGTSILVILTKGVKEDAEGEKLIAAIAGDIWDYFSTETQTNSASLQMRSLTR